jgi:hypothetical protein
MAIWQMMKAGEPADRPPPNAVPNFDDGSATCPGDDQFSTDAVTAHLSNLGGVADGFNYVGPSPTAAA